MSRSRTPLPWRALARSAAAISGLLLAAISVLSPADASAASCDPTALFGPPNTLSSGPNPLYLVSADFNEDGILDLAVTNCDFQAGGAAGSVSVFRGLGGLGYAAPTLYPVGLNPHMLVTGDFNEDGITDLVTANKWSSSISVLRGLGSGGVGNGTFAPATNYSTGGYPFQIVVADLDNDGIQDLAVSINDAGKVALLRGGGSGGVGDGSFALVASLPIASASTGLASGDFNEDGQLDLVATENGAGTIALLLGTGGVPLGTGSFAPAAHLAGGPLPFEFAVGDFNEDNHLDLAVAEQTAGGGTQVLLGNGNGTFQPPATLPTGNTVAVTPDDVNQDGITDLVVCRITGGDTGDTRVCLGLGSAGVGNGSFAPPTAYGPVGDTYQALAGDFDGDGRRDLAVSYYLKTTFAMLPGTCEAGGTPPPDPRRPVIADIRDVPNDQGGKVFVTWSKSSLDVTGGAVTGYTVWRLVPPAGAVEHTAALAALSTDPARFRRELRARPDGATEIEYWEALATLPAQRLPGYGYTAATPQDSLRHSNGMFTYRITATTPNIDIFYDSDPDSGYSVDNLPPGPPGGLTADWNAGGAQLDWTANPEPDVVGYAVHRSDDPSFTPSPATLVGTPEASEFTDSSPHPYATYKVAAVDKHDNESPYASVDMGAVTGVGEGRPGTTWLAVPWPNPANGPFDLRYGLARDGRVTLVVLDAQGRRVRTLADGVRPAGDATLRWDARDDSGALVGAGLYWLDLRAGPQHVVRRFAFVR